MNAAAEPSSIEIAIVNGKVAIFPLDAWARVLLDRSKSGLKTITAGLGRFIYLVQRPRATVIDIARKAGVSRATVSLVLRGSDLIKKDTAAKVRQAMEEVGYVYNRAAANLRTARTNFVGMIMSDLKNPFFTELAVGIEDSLYRLGLTPILANTNDDLERQNQVLRSMLENGVQGIILSPARGTEAEHLDFLPRSLPVILAMRRIEGCELPYVGQDNRAGARKAAEHLISLGHERIAFFGGDGKITTQQERYAGYCDALQAANLPVARELVFETSVSKTGGAEALDRALASAAKPTAATCYNDLIAIGATRALAMRDMRAGRNFAVVGFDNLAEAKDNFPPLTTIDAETFEMGGRAAQALIQIIDGSASPSIAVTGSSRLVVRDSCGARTADRRSASQADINGFHRGEVATA
jgi:LacI family transcriptional regulator